MQRRLASLALVAATTWGCTTDHAIAPEPRGELSPGTSSAGPQASAPSKDPVTAGATQPPASTTGPTSAPETYAAAGCRRTHAFDGMPPLRMAPLPDIVDGIICEIDDDATHVPACDAIAAIYQHESKPTRAYGVIVARHSTEASECQGGYEASGKFVGDLPWVD